MDVLYIISAAIGPVITGIFGWLMAKRKYKAEERRLRADEFSEIIKVWTQDNSRLRLIEESHTKELAKLKSEISKLRYKMILIESSHFDVPFPMWLKDLDGTMLSLNDSYEKMFLTPLGLSRDDYLGKYDSDIWNKKSAFEFKINDRKVINSPEKYLKLKEEVIDPSGNSLGVFEVIKYARYADGTLIGVGGILIPNKK